MTITFDVPWGYPPMWYDEQSHAWREFCDWPVSDCPLCGGTGWHTTAGNDVKCECWADGE